MNWPKAIVREVETLMRLERDKPPKTRLVPRFDQGWLSDPHLKKGFFYGATPIFLVACTIAMIRPLGIAANVLLALTMNVGWLGYSAWSRQRAGETTAE